MRKRFSVHEPQTSTTTHSRSEKTNQFSVGAELYSALTVGQNEKMLSRAYFI